MGQVINIDIGAILSETSRYSPLTWPPRGLAHPYCRRIPFASARLQNNGIMWKSLGGILGHHIKSAHAPGSNMAPWSRQNRLQSFRAFFYDYLEGFLRIPTNGKKIPHTNFTKRKLSQKLIFSIRNGLN